MVNLAAFTLIYIALLMGRMVVGRLEEEAGTAFEPVAGAAVLPPRLDGAADV